MFKKKKFKPKSKFKKKNNYYTKIKRDNNENKKLPS